ncbi:MAG: RlmE family RNA methyltransferase [Alphaproteobacteria bacterium]|nr:RlmE family RNA methyltransferase [Alphaproteobacteria bacterium]
MQFNERHLKTNLRRGGRWSKSSAKWLQRQLNDPYVSEAKAQGFRGRAAFKIEQMNQQFHFFKKGSRVVDLGCAPGGWTQVAVKAVHSSPENPLVIGLDLLPTDPVDGAILLQRDFREPAVAKELIDLLGGQKADVVMSDMAANTTGNHMVDHLRIMGLVETAYDFAIKVLNNGGTFVAKIFQGGTEKNLLNKMKSDFLTVKHVKPEASRKDSSEFYVVASGFKGDK